MRSYTLNPSHPAGQLARTIRVAGCEPRLVLFTVGGTIELDRQETEFMAKEIALGFIGLAGTTFAPKPRTEPAKLDPLEDPRDPETYDPIPPEQLRSWWNPVILNWSPFTRRRN